MKKIFFTVAIFGFLFSNAQQNIYLYPQKPIKKFYQPWISTPKKNFKQEWDNGLKDLANPLPQAKLLYTLKDNTKVFSLPQDNMISLVPDMKQFNMPNAGIAKLPFTIPSELKDQLQHQPGRIPNAITPYDIIPQRKDTPTQ